MPERLLKHFSRREKQTTFVAIGALKVKLNNIPVSLSNFRSSVEKSPLKPKNVSPSKESDSPVKAPARKRARIIESDEEEEENNVEVQNTGSEKKTAQRLEKVCEEKQLVSTLA